MQNVGSETRRFYRVPKLDWQKSALLERKVNHVAFNLYGRILMIELLYQTMQKIDNVLKEDDVKGGTVFLCEFSYWYGSWS